MLAYLARRLAGTAVLLVAVVFLSLALINLAPGDAAVTLAGSAGDAEYLAELRERLGLDRPLIEQGVTYLATLLRGDLGFSVVQGQPVADMILARLPATLLLAGTAVAIAFAAGVLLGAHAALRRGSRFDTVVSVSASLSYSVPAFWVGQLAVGFLAVRLGWFPAGGMRSQGAPSGLAGAADLARHLVLPALTLSLPLWALVVRTARTSIAAELSEPYVTAARALGIAERRIVFHHALRSALRPVVTVVSYQIGFVLTGAVLVEVIFSWPGLGRLLLSSVLSRDNPMLVGLLVFLSVLVVLVNLLADLVTGVLDPRVRYQ